MRPRRREKDPSGATKLRLVWFRPRDGDTTVHDRFDRDWVKNKMLRSQADDQICKRFDEESCKICTPLLILFVVIRKMGGKCFVFFLVHIFTHNREFE